MNRTKISVLLSLCLLLALAPAQAQTKRAINFDDLISMHRVGDPQLSPDGKWVAYTVATPDKAANRTVRNVWLVPTAGGEARQLTRSGRDMMARWSPDGSKIAFLSSRDGGMQIYLIALEGGEATKLTSISTGADNVQWSPDGKMLAFTSSVYPDCKDDACNAKRDADAEKSKVKARIYDRLLYRHWSDWWDYKRSHLFVVGVDGANPRDLTSGADYDTPPVQRGGAESIAWSPDSKELCYTAVTDKVEATSTNGDLFVVPAAGGDSKRITSATGFDGNPVYSPDGKSIAYRSQLRAGYEADRWRLMLYDRASGKHTNLTENFDRSAESYAWSPDSRMLYFNAEDRGFVNIFSMAPTAGSDPKPILKDSYHAEFVLSDDGKTLVFSRQSMAMPAELFTSNADGTGVRQLTKHNAAKLAQLDMNKAEHIWFDAADGVKIHAMLLRPPAFDAAKKYPLLVICHGGPQTQFSDAWSYRWNPQMFAAPGYVVLMVNRRGSTGFGQKFADDINADWGGKAYQDVMKGVDYALAKYPFIDGTRMAAAGGSYGGYMINWMASQSKGRFKALISHAGVYNFESEYGATEELWFPEWDYRGTPWNDPGKNYEKFSPNKFAAEFGKYKTPTLVITGELDFRVPYTQSLEFYTALQRQGVPSKLLIYPDEGHWILKPQNSELWYKTFLDWLATYLK
ncbi:MAG: S9 family peptidase [Acidobacteria bacterium]|nr:S9 family peptidase [Acidobacteriota bacterium]MCL5287469.1 S9 family peptidase [Acidobacteriota bacterium]